MLKISIVIKNLNNYLVKWLTQLQKLLDFFFTNKLLTTKQLLTYINITGLIET